MRKPFIYAADTAELRVTVVNHSAPKVHTRRGPRTKSAHSSGDLIDSTIYFGIKTGLMRHSK